MKWNFLNCLTLHVSWSVKKTCFVQFLLKNRALNFSWVFFDPPVITDDLEISSGDSDQECSKKKIKKG